MVGGNVAHFITIASQPTATSAGLCCEATIKALDGKLSISQCVSALTVVESRNKLIEMRERDSRSSREVIYVVIFGGSECGGLG